MDLSKPSTSGTNNSDEELLYSNFDNQSKTELLTHVHLLLKSIGLEKSANVLGEEIEDKGFVPERYNFNGHSFKETFDDYLQRMKPFSSNLIELTKRLNYLTSQLIPPVVQNLPLRLFTSKRQSLIRKKNVLKQLPQIGQIACRRIKIAVAEKIHPMKILSIRELGSQRCMLEKLILRKESVKKFNLQTRILGHLGPIYCVKFDVNGRYIFTGADDNLIKVWNAQTCLLRYTFRGHTSYIMDLTISQENTMLASGSMDKTVRVWCLQRGKLLFVYKGHTATISTISFIPYFRDDSRYLVSAGNDCSVVFYKYYASTKDFSDPPIKFNERSRPGTKIMTMCHSPGGNFVVMGDTHQNVRIFQITDNGVERLFHVAAHTDRVDSLVWAHNALRFVTGSRDGTAKAWYITENGWNSSTFKVLNSSETNSNNALSNNRNYNTNFRQNISSITFNNMSFYSIKKKNAYKVTMMCWSLFDDIVITSGSDTYLRTWNWKTGELLKILNGHTNESFVLLAHPVHKEIILSVGHDGMLLIWNIYEGVCIKKHKNESENGDLKAIFDMAISPDGSIISFVDNHGHLSILGLNSKQITNPYLKEQFFSTDYRQLSMDEAGYVLDERTGLAPENMDPPIFVNSEGCPHPAASQQLVPGNDFIKPRIEPICAWVTRSIVQGLNDLQLEQVYENWAVINKNELDEFKSSNAGTLISQKINTDHRCLVPRPRKPRNPHSNGAQRRAHFEQMTNLLMNPPLGEPRYVIGEEDDTDEDDSSYSEEDESNQSDEINTNCSSIPANQNDDFIDDLDSDYEEGRPEHTTVYRTRSSHTVTGRRKKQKKNTHANGDSTNISSNTASTSASIDERYLSRRKNLNRAVKSVTRKRLQIFSSDEETSMSEEGNQKQCNNNLEGVSINTRSKKTELKNLQNSLENDVVIDEENKSTSYVDQLNGKIKHKKRGRPTVLREVLNDGLDEEEEEIKNKTTTNQRLQNSTSNNVQLLNQKTLRNRVLYNGSLTEPSDQISLNVSSKNANNSQEMKKSKLYDNSDNSNRANNYNYNKATKNDSRETSQSSNDLTSQSYFTESFSESNNEFDMDDDGNYYGETKKRKKTNKLVGRRGRKKKFNNSCDTLVKNTFNQQRTFARASRDVARMNVQAYIKALDENLDYDLNNGCENLPSTSTRSGKKYPKRLGNKAINNNTDENENLNVVVYNESKKRSYGSNTITNNAKKSKIIEDCEISKTPVVYIYNSPDPTLYCICQKPEYGEMIQCENDDCIGEWFHVGCVGLNSIPKGKWYCDHCTKKLKLNKKR